MSPVLVHVLTRVFQLLHVRVGNGGGAPVRGLSYNVLASLFVVCVGHQMAQRRYQWHRLRIDLVHQQKRRRHRVTRARRNLQLRVRCQEVGKLVRKAWHQWYIEALVAPSNAALEPPQLCLL